MEMLLFVFSQPARGIMALEAVEIREDDACHALGVHRHSVAQFNPTEPGKVAEGEPITQFERELSKHLHSPDDHQHLVR